MANNKKFCVMIRSTALSCEMAAWREQEARHYATDAPTPDCAFIEQLYFAMAVDAPITQTVEQTFGERIDQKPCARCGSTIVQEEEQTRAADEPKTQFQTCLGCGFRVRGEGEFKIVSA